MLYDLQMQLGAWLWNTINLEFLIKFAIAYFFILWFCLILWVANDISKRTQNLFFQIFCVILMLCTTPLWVFLYLILRPKRDIYGAFLHEIDDNLKLLEKIVEEKVWHNCINEIHCPNCLQKVDEEYLVCPNCAITLKKNCQKCGKFVRVTWNVCPYCQKKQ